MKKIWIGLTLAAALSCSVMASQGVFEIKPMVTDAHTHQPEK
ncbi:hypothetical protein ACIP6T_04035 [Pantoea sp. NPDC088449]|uniref:Uncharacterized protein n=1 Tax=Candidatus Pantoea floridensis TaxID=1938870 RepID=A0A286BM68_9GAMM|nr:hypothetical protein [Pantoea floridensis]PIF22444.1 hypothetical protein BX596_1859 [Enterobacteriaceae bacterium JKS000233]SOD35257.1 hypothetical protein SAMN06273570_0182 [Pantoea floridensis]